MLSLFALLGRRGAVEANNGAIAVPACTWLAWQAGQTSECAERVLGESFSQHGWQGMRWVSWAFALSSRGDTLDKVLGLSMNGRSARQCEAASVHQTVHDITSIAGGRAYDSKA